MDNIFLSIVLPVRNEENNLNELHNRLNSVCSKFNKPYELIYVENGSTDNSVQVLKNLKGAKIIILRWKPYMRKAQSLAMDAGFKVARGKYVIYMDADLQVDPEEIPRFIEKLEEGYEVVCGWRDKRFAENGIKLFFPLYMLLRNIFSLFRKMLINEGVRDPGSSIKGFTKEALENIDLYGEMHRYLVAILHWQGFSITEISIKHRPRKSGKSNYTMAKGFRGFADLISIFLWRKYADRPLHYLGVSGLIISASGVCFLVLLLILRLLKFISLSNSIFPILAILIIIVGVQLFVSGILADTLSRIFYSTGRNKAYLIKEELEN